VRGNSRGGQAVFTIAGKPRSPARCLERVSLSRGAANEATAGRGVETGRTARESSRRRHGRSRTRKEAEGRREAARLLGRGKLSRANPRDGWGRATDLEARGRSAGGTGSAGQLAFTGAGAAQTAEGLRKPVEGAARRARSGDEARGRHRTRVWQPSSPAVGRADRGRNGAPRVNVVGTKNPRRGGHPSVGESRRSRRREPLGRRTSVAL
jgi:hypothetical protein